MKIRRVVTSHDDKGKAQVAIDEVSRDVVSFRPGATVANIWSTAGFPVTTTASGTPPRRSPRRRGQAARSSA